MKQSYRPGKGSILKVDPIRSESRIRAIKLLLKNHRRNFLLFVMGVNTNLRMCDLLSLTIGKVRHLQEGNVLVVRERKTGKIRRINLNNAVIDALNPLLTQCKELPDDVALFRSLKTGQAIKVATVNNLIKDWCKQVRLEGHYGCHTLRKTFGYIHRTKHRTDIPTLMHMYNHSTQRQTLEYLGVDEEDVKAAYKHEI